MTAKLKKVTPPKISLPSKTAKPFTFVLDEEDFDRLISEPMWSIDYIANVFRNLQHKPAQAAIRLLDQAYRGVQDYFGSDTGGLEHRKENMRKDGKILSEADVLAYREKLSPMFELIDLTEDMDTEDEMYQAVSILRIMCTFFENAALELEAKFAEAKREEGAA